MKAQLIKNLVNDLLNEWKHLHFYMFSSFSVTSLHRLTLKDWLWKQSGSEREHIKMFSEMLLGLGASIDFDPSEFKSFPCLSNPKDILSYALEMETEVVENYTERILEAEKIPGSDTKFIQVFLEEQLEDSRKDADEISMLLKGMINDKTRT